jgi:REP element-mobilizing transposase RayT
MNRGDRREKIFEEDEDRHRFLKTLAEACEKTGWQVHAYCLMSNHFHLVIETPQANFVAGMKQKASSWLCKPEPASISSVEEGLPFPVAMFSNPG